MERFETNEEIIYTLIIDDLDKTITPENSLILMKWRNSSADNERTYLDFLNIHINLDRLAEEKGYDVDESWGILDQKLSVAVPLKKRNYLLGYGFLLQPRYCWYAQLVIIFRLSRL